MMRYALLQVETFLANVVNYYSLSNEKSTYFKLGNCIVNVLCQFLTKYYLLKVFILEYNLSIELKNHSCPDIILYKLFYFI